MPTIIFLNRQFKKVNSDILVSLTPGCVEGKGVFETMQIRQRKILDFDAHMNRMKQGLDRLGLCSPYPTSALRRTIQKILSLNKLSDARLRIMIWKEKQGATHVAIIAQALNAPSKFRYDSGFSAIVSEMIRPQSQYSHLKSIQYHIFRRAFNEARQKGYAEAILLNSKGELVEGATSNVFVIKNNIVYTPLMRSGCLNGITRRNVLSLLRDLNIKCRVKSLKVLELIAADEAFLTNSLIGIVPLTKVNEKEIGKSHPGPMTLQIMAAYRDSMKSRLT